MPVVQHLQYDNGGALAEIEVTDRASTETQVHGLRYNARGQRTQVEHGNGVTTTFTYDPDTFRLTRQVAERSDASKLQDLRLTWGPAGQIFAIRDGIQTLVYYDNEITHPERQFVYDARGRLIRATGREHATTYGLDPAAVPGTPCSIPGPANEVSGYIRDYEWDAAGNMTELSVVGGWTRTLVYESGNNRLKTFTWSSPSTTTNYITYDQFGQMEGLPSAKDLRWDGDGNLRYSSPLTTGATTRTWYQYSGAQRVRKVTEKEHATGWYVAKETIYLDSGFEVYRTYDAPGTLELEREHVRITDGAGHALEIETVLVEGGSAVSTAVPLYRYSLVDQIGSVSVELDQNAAVVSYEEYHPFGTTAYYGDTRGAQAKRYRYSGKERDAETGLYYYGYRYYAPGVARWTAPDPLGAQAGLNPYDYVAGNPSGRVDRDGRQDHPITYPREQGGFGAPPETEARLQRERNSSSHASDPSLGAAIPSMLPRYAQRALYRALTTRDVAALNAGLDLQPVAGSVEAFRPASQPELTYRHTRTITQGFTEGPRDIGTNRISWFSSYDLAARAVEQGRGAELAELDVDAASRRGVTVLGTEQLIDDLRGLHAEQLAIADETGFRRPLASARRIMTAIDRVTGFGEAHTVGDVPRSAITRRPGPPGLPDNLALGLATFGFEIAAGEALVRIDESINDSVDPTTELLYRAAPLPLAVSGAPALRHGLIQVDRSLQESIDARRQSGDSRLRDLIEIDMWRCAFGAGGCH